jgi:hypothetical protein
MLAVCTRPRAEDHQALLLLLLLLLCTLLLLPLLHRQPPPRRKTPPLLHRGLCCGICRASRRASHTSRERHSRRQRPRDCALERCPQ